MFTRWYQLTPAAVGAKEFCKAFRSAKFISREAWGCETDRALDDFQAKMLSCWVLDPWGRCVIFLSAHDILIACDTALFFWQVRSLHERTAKIQLVGVDLKAEQFATAKLCAARNFEGRLQLAELGPIKLERMWCEENIGKGLKYIIIIHLKLMRSDEFSKDFPLLEMETV